MGRTLALLVCLLLPAPVLAVGIPGDGGGGGGGGSTTHLGLTDTPGSYATFGGLPAVVNGAETAIEYVPLPPAAIEDIVASNFCLLSGGVGGDPGFGVCPLDGKGTDVTINGSSAVSILNLGDSVTIDVIECTALDTPHGDCTTAGEAIWVARRLASPDDSVEAVLGDDGSLSVVDGGETVFETRNGGGDQRVVLESSGPGVPAKLLTDGTDADVGLRIDTKGDGDVDLRSPLVVTHEAVVITDSGDGNAGTLSWEPGTSRAQAHINCQDADGCDLTITESGSTLGDDSLVLLVREGTNVVTLLDHDDLVIALDAPILLDELGESVLLVRVNGKWVVAARSDRDFGAGAEVALAEVNGVVVGSLVLPGALDALIDGTPTDGELLMEDNASGKMKGSGCIVGAGGIGCPTPADGLRGIESPVNSNGNERAPLSETVLYQGVDDADGNEQPCITRPGDTTNDCGNYGIGNPRWPSRQFTFYGTDLQAAQVAAEQCLSIDAGDIASILQTPTANPNTDNDSRRWNGATHMLVHRHRYHAVHLRDIEEVADKGFVCVKGDANEGLSCTEGVGSECDVAGNCQAFRFYFDLREIRDNAGTFEYSKLGACVGGANDGDPCRGDDDLDSDCASPGVCDDPMYSLEWVDDDTRHGEQTSITLVDHPRGYADAVGLQLCLSAPVPPSGQIGTTDWNFRALVETSEEQ